MWWLARGEEHLPADETWLSPMETGYAESRRFTKRRTEFLVARWAAKHALAQVLSVPPTPAGLRRVEVRHAPTGAPIAYLDGHEAGVQISLTDRAGWAVCFVSRAPRSVGCDLELVEARTDGFVHDFLTEAERCFVDSMSTSAARYLAANLVWSAKECGLKVLGTGLRRDSRSVEVTVEFESESGSGEWNSLAVRTAEGRLFPGWWRRYGEFVLTVAGQDDSPRPSALDDPPLLERAVPTHSWLNEPARLNPTAG